MKNPLLITLVISFSLPWTGDAQTLSAPEIAVEAAHTEAGISSDGFLTLTYFQDKASTGLLFYLQASPSLFSWTTPNATTTSTEDAGDFWRITLRDTVPVSEADRRFLRLKIMESAGISTLLFPPTTLGGHWVWDGKILRASLSWSDNSPIETGFSIERGLGSGFQSVATTAPDTAFYLDPRAAPPNSTATYRVRAFAPGEASAYTNELTLTTPLDTDLDGIPDRYELGEAYAGEEGYYATDPFRFSSGTSGLSDGWLIRYGLDPFTADPFSDDDEDGLSLAEEAERGTDPNLKDTDGDGIDDGEDALPTDDRFTHPRVSESRYLIIPLPGFPLSMNNRGQAILYADNDRQLLWDSGQSTELDITETGSRAHHAINDEGEIAGSQGPLFLFQNGSYTDLGLPPPRESEYPDNPETAKSISSIHGLSSDGVIACLVDFGVSGPLDVPYVYANGQWIELFNDGLALSGGIITGSRGGNYVAGARFGETAVWSRAGVERLQDTYSSSINDAGAFTDGGAQLMAKHPVTGQRFSVPTEELWPDTPAERYVSSINNRFEMVGQDYTAYPYKLLLWKNDKVVTLDSLIPADSGWTMNGLVSGLNDLGMIIGMGHYAGSGGPVEETGYFMFPQEFIVLPPASAGATPDDTEVSADVAELEIHGLLQPSHDGSVVKWSLEENNSGGALSENETETDGEIATTKLTTSTQAGATYKIKGEIRKIVLPPVLPNVPPTTFDFAQIGYGKVSSLDTLSGQIKVVAGFCTAITAERKVEEQAVTSVPADGKTEVEFTATFKDQFGNLVAEDTPVYWHLAGLGELEIIDEATDAEGKARARVTAGDVAGEPQKLTIEADGTEIVETLANTAVAITLTASQPSLDMHIGESATLTASFPGVADGAEIRWFSSRGALTGAATSVQGGQATATLRASGGPVATALATVQLGSTIKGIEIPFTSSAPISVSVEHPVIAGDAAADGVHPVPRLDGTIEQVPYFASTQVTIKAPAHPGRLARIGAATTEASVFARYSFDVLENGATPDSVSGYHAAVTGATLDPANKHEGAAALALDGAATATIPDNENLRLRDGLKVSLWVNPTDAGEAGLVVKEGEWELALDAAGHPTFSIATAAGAQTIAAPAPLTPGRWTHLTGEYRSGKVTLTVDGAAHQLAVAAAITPGTAPITLGDAFIGNLDLLVISVGDHLENTSAVTLEGLDATNEIALDQNGEATITVRGSGNFTGSVESIDLAITIDPLSAANPTASQYLRAQNPAEIQQTIEGAVQVATAQDIATADALAGRAQVEIPSQLDFTSEQRQAVVARMLCALAETGERTAALDLRPSGGLAERRAFAHAMCAWVGVSVQEMQDLLEVLETINGLSVAEAEKAPLMEEFARLAMAAVDKRSDSSGGSFLKNYGNGLLEEMPQVSQPMLGEFSALMDGAATFDDYIALRSKFPHDELISQLLDMRTITILGDSIQSLSPAHATAARRRWLFRMQFVQESMELIDANAAFEQAEDYLAAMVQKGLDSGALTPDEAYALGYMWGFVRTAGTMGAQLNPVVLAKSLSDFYYLVTAAAAGNAEAKAAIRTAIPVYGFFVGAGSSKQLYESGQYFKGGAAWSATVTGAVSDVFTVAKVTMILKGVRIRIPGPANKWIFQVRQQPSGHIIGSYQALGAERDILVDRLLLPGKKKDWQVHHADNQAHIAKIPGIHPDALKDAPSVLTYGGNHLKGSLHDLATKAQREWFRERIAKKRASGEPVKFSFKETELLFDETMIILRLTKDDRQLMRFLRSEWMKKYNIAPDTKFDPPGF